MNITSEQYTTPIVLKAHILSEATSDKKVSPSEEIPSTSLTQRLKPQKKISKKKKKSKRRRRLREVTHFD